MFKTQKNDTAKQLSKPQVPSFKLNKGKLCTGPITIFKLCCSGLLMIQYYLCIRFRQQGCRGTLVTSLPLLENTFSFRFTQVKAQVKMLFRSIRTNSLDRSLRLKYQLNQGRCGGILFQLPIESVITKMKQISKVVWNCDMVSEFSHQ